MVNAPATAAALSVPNPATPSCWRHFCSVLLK